MLLVEHYVQRHECACARCVQVSSKKTTRRPWVKTEYEQVMVLISQL